MYLIDTIMEAALQTVPDWQIVDDFCPSATEFAGIQAITYDGLTVEGGKSKGLSKKELYFLIFESVWSIILDGVKVLIYTKTDVAYGF